MDAVLEPSRSVPEGKEGSNHMRPSEAPERGSSVTVLEKRGGGGGLGGAVW